MTPLIRLLCLSLLLQGSQGWLLIPSNNKQLHYHNQKIGNHLLQKKEQPKIVWSKFLRDMAAASVIFSNVGMASILIGTPLPVHAAATSGSIEEQIIESLKPATEYQPQIMLPKDANLNQITSKQQKQGPILEGLIYLGNPNSDKRPLVTDSIVLTFRDLSQPDVVLGGARIPVSQARFPFSFRMFPQNLLPDKVDQWNQQSRKDDILVQALICPEEIPKCQEAESRLQAQGVAKLIRNLPGQGEDQMIRAAASLPLK